MKLVVAQIKPFVGPIERNVNRHMALIDLAIDNGADLIVFPELSLTGYEPTQAANLSRSIDDQCFDPFAFAAETYGISISVGFPLMTDALPRISMRTVGPGSPPVVYSKRYLHPDEEPFFDCGPDAAPIIHDAPKIAIAICFELSVPEHANHAFELGATTYIASAAKTAAGVEAANQRLSHLAASRSAIVMLSNSRGWQDGSLCAGCSAAWGRKGNLLGQLDADTDGIVVVDDQTEEVKIRTLQSTGD
ncbi:MAG: carbon-nitrogen hydrolase family protein [Planctomycetaceae bacterium]